MRKIVEVGDNIVSDTGIVKKKISILRLQTVMHAVELCDSFHYIAVFDIHVSGSWTAHFANHVPPHVADSHA